MHTVAGHKGEDGFYRQPPQRLCPAKGSNRLGADRNRLIVWVDAEAFSFHTVSCEPKRRNMRHVPWCQAHISAHFLFIRFA